MSTNSSNPWAALARPETPVDASAVQAAATPPPDAAAAAANPWGSLSAPAPTGNAAAPVDWLQGAAPSPGDVPVPSFDILHPFKNAVLPLDRWVEHGLNWVVTNFREVFQQVRLPIDGSLTFVEHTLQSVPSLLMIALFGLAAWQVSGRRLALGTVVSLLLIGFLGVWSQAMTTLALVITAVAFCFVIGLPLGILAARSDRLEKFLRPVLDAMQTTPAFVYLVPVVMLFGIGNVPGVVVTIVFALAPLVRLTSLGIRQVRPDLIEASRAFGATPWQMLTKVQLPLAMPTIMAGVNQTLMLSLSMVVIASMIAVGGLGQMVLRGIGRLDMGLATVGGLGIVILAIVLDRMTQALIRQDVHSVRFTERGPIGLLVRLLALLFKRKNTPGAEHDDQTRPQQPASTDNATDKDADNSGQLQTA
ncbi:glycine betaine/L-proline ABC transporter permease ProW [Herbaspirillum sp. RTI4]|uniref:glycine betaine/L-proline ABC transporter permease ProW n=1 Tax=Herbaspirillum sp. RTI4 TaxID=3048640 RepID=UPI002AB3F0FE|nr:glycine betaine/L-proline ABC transporter permease ProW [Herbaspirillum sp. RTI4]MDY7578854.1 glycine betaine/L-proline ABC transporter permease ProW [Herbaspirillum sp. RTI4]MEA9982997.1 glycine betaine/L-proline ABC transporter permease ProW [Herbaspirillum sp. RTI4]